MTTKALKTIAGAPDRPLVIGDIEIPCYVLEDETRVLSQRGFLGAIGRSVSRPASGGEQLPAFLASERLKPFISNELAAATKAVEFQPPDGGRSAYGYRATMLPQVCEVYLKARDASALAASQRHIAERAEIIIRGLATVGIIALIDEATGYERIREKRALATILEKFIDKELQKWTKTFPYEFYELIYKLKGWSGPDGHKRPPLIGLYTNQIVYDRLAPGVLDELKRRTPRRPSGNRPHKFFQWFTPDFGHPKLKEHLAGVMALMRAAPNWNAFKRSLQRAYPRAKDQLSINLGDE